MRSSSRRHQPTSPSARRSRTLRICSLRGPVAPWSRHQCQRPPVADFLAVFKLVAAGRCLRPSLPLAVFANLLPRRAQRPLLLCRPKLRALAACCWLHRWLTRSHGAGWERGRRPRRRVAGDRRWAAELGLAVTGESRQCREQRACGENVPTLLFSPYSPATKFLFLPGVGGGFPGGEATANPFLAGVVDGVPRGDAAVVPFLSVIGVGVDVAPGSDRPYPSSQAQAPALLQAAMQPPSSSSQASASALFQGVPARRPPLPAQAPPPPRFGADGPLRPAPLPRRRLPQPPYSSMQARESMEGHAPWETLNPLSYEAPGVDFSTAYSMCDEEFLHMSNFGKAVPDSPNTLWNFIIVELTVHYINRRRNKFFVTIR
uniref:Uncharacterized protein n=1 Tax=Oryza barthii TaxID=65489 RepID=A0A0D3EJQ1_9ORYZ